ncbi:MAG TPA: aldo/keto reductase [Planctomycetaceae bacterium]|nr:aldo/keto reductase [Planctomycetaceae bacterium]
MLEQHRLGTDGPAVTRLGFGSMGLRGPRTWGVRTVDEARAESVLNSVLDAGINFIDTATVYGIAEERIGRYLSSRRSEFRIATKCGRTAVQHADHLEIQPAWSRDSILQNIESSLLRLQTDFIDLLQFHGGDYQQLRQAGLIDLLHDKKSEGVIGQVGVSTQLPAARELIESGAFDVVQLPFSCLAPEHSQLLGLASARGMGTIVRGGIAQGGPQAEIQREKLNAVWSRAKLDEVLPAGMRPAEFILRYTLSQKHVNTTIVGTANLAHLSENVAAAKRGGLPSELEREITHRVAEVLQEDRD